MRQRENVQKIGHTPSSSAELIAWMTYENMENISQTPSSFGLKEDLKNFEPSTNLQPHPGRPNDPQEALERVVTSFARFARAESTFAVKGKEGSLAQKGGAEG